MMDVQLGEGTLRHSYSALTLSLVQGDKVKLTMQFKGREMEFKSLGREMFEVIHPFWKTDPTQDARKCLNVCQSCLEYGTAVYLPCGQHITRLVGCSDSLTISARRERWHRTLR